MRIMATEAYLDQAGKSIIAASDFKDIERFCLDALAQQPDGWLPVPLNEWHEDVGNVLWWFFPVSEPPYCGTPFDDEWPTINGESYHTHFTRISIPKPPAGEEG